MVFDLLFAGSYQPRIGGGDGKKNFGKVGSKGSVLGDQPVVFHKTIKSSGYGKEQPVMLLLLVVLLLLPLTFVTTGHAHVRSQSAPFQEKTYTWKCKRRGAGSCAV